MRAVERAGAIMAQIQRALLSVYVKDGLVELASFLADQGVELISTGGTARTLREAGIAVTGVREVTGFPEIMGGRVKTLHPRVAGGVLGRTQRPDDLAEMEEHGIRPIDLVVVNLYPFEQAVARPDCAFDEALEMIDIGGPTLIRSAAKNHTRVAVVVDPADYPAIIEEMRDNHEISSDARARLAAKAFRRTAAYDAAISRYLDDDPFAEQLTLSMKRQQVLRYGENPHQRAALYAEPGWSGPSLTNAEQLGGKKLSYNNLADADGALGLVREFDEPAAVIVKHTNPCGVAQGAGAAQAFERALQTDPMSAFGGIVAVNRPIDEAAAEAIAGVFFEVVIAPDFTEAALERLQRKKMLRLLRLPDLADEQRGAPDLTRIRGGYLVTDWDDAAADTWDVVTRRAPSDDEMRALRFAWRVVKHVRSNAIVLTTADQAVGIGAGQMSRVDSVEIAVRKAQLPTAGCVMGSDAFFPFRDGVDAAAEAGGRAVVQPGGSKRDAEVIAAADEHGMAMIVTHMRHFRH